MSFLTPLRGNPAFRDLVNGFVSSHAGHQIRGISKSFPSSIQVSPCLMGEPLKKKKRIDPAILRQREERKRRKIEKEIKSLQKLGKVLKPIEEARMPLCVYNNEGERKRVVDVPDDVMEERILLVKKWNRMRTIQVEMERRMITRLLRAQDKALAELKKESEELYQAAIQVDEKFLPFQFKGPVETPPIQDYQFPDGDYIDVSKDWSQEMNK